MKIKKQNHFQYKKELDSYIKNFSSDLDLKIFQKKHHDRKLTEKEILIIKEVKDFLYSYSKKVLNDNHYLGTFAKEATKLTYSKYNPNTLYECLSNEPYDFLLLLSEYNDKMNTSS